MAGTGRPQPALPGFERAPGRLRAADRLPDPPLVAALAESGMPLYLRELLADGPDGWGGEPWEGDPLWS
jgi:hypothetical protein